ncbi:MAG: peptidase U32 [Armatimonadota bacterium]
MGFSVATNFDDNLPGLVASLGVTELFGKLPKDVTGGGRASYMMAPVSREMLEEHVRKTHQAGLKFNYLVNAACLDNTEFTKRGQKEIRKHLDWLSEVGIDALTVSVSYLLELVKSRYSHFKVKLGVFADIDTPKKAIFFEELGADCIALQPLILNRNFAGLRAIREAVKCELQLIVNSNCLLECPMTPYHNAGLSHASQKGSRGFFVDYCLLRCLTRKLTDPVNYITSPWIRPEDLHHYEAIGKFSFKILERDAPTETLVKRVRAYYNGQFDGNLLDIVQSYGFREQRSASQPQRPWLWDLREFLKPQAIRPFKLLPLRDLARLQGMLYTRSDEKLVVDNRKLDGFIDKFLDGDCLKSRCEDCRYCHSYADKAVHIDPVFRQECLELVGLLLNDLSSGEMWGRCAEPRWRCE